uniref:Uncharacterized protein n=1 Tax=Cucumis melo TaxID=3656 RepID=A0A9I9EBN7_CUCME
MTSKQDQLVVALYNPGALTIFQSQKNLNKTRKTTFWKAVKIDRRNSYSQLELDEIRVEWAEFLARYI